MEYIKSIMLLVICVSGCLSANPRFLDVPCPQGCVAASCYINLGCTNCQPGYCQLLTKYGSLCVTDCGKDKSCSSFGICTADRAH